MWKNAEIYEARDFHVVKNTDLLQKIEMKFEGHDLYLYWTGYKRLLKSALLAY